MEFRENRAIYLQIMDYVSEQILLDRWKAGDKIVSVRELAAQLEVNPNTVARSYELLQNQQMIVNKRGIGFFVADDALKKIKKWRKDEFLKQELPLIFKTMYLLDLDISCLQEEYHKFIKEIDQLNHENK